MKQISKKNIDKYNLLLTDKKNILKIIFISVLTVILMLSFQVSQKKKLNVSLKILPITFEKQQQYKYLNYFVKKNINSKEVVLLNEINESYLLDLFITELEEGSLLYELIDEHKLIQRSNYNNIDDYEFAINSIISSMEFKPITTLDTQNPFKNLQEVSKIENKTEYWNLELEINHEDKKVWNKILVSIEKKINDKIFLFLKKEFELAHIILEQRHLKRIEIIKNQIQSTLLEANSNLEIFEKELKFKLQDVDILIKNSYKDYENDKNDRLAYLKEQAAIARALNIKFRSIDADLMNNEEIVVLSSNNDQPFYTRGFLAIEKEIKLIESRKKIRPFVKGLNGLEKTKREILQNKKVQRKIIDKKYLEEINKLKYSLADLKAKSYYNQFKEIVDDTFVSNNIEFKAANTFKNKVLFENNSPKIFILLILSSIIGTFLGIIYIVISNIFKK